MAMGHCFGYNEEVLQSDLSPMSALRLNFDALTPETTDIMPEHKTVFGVPVPQFVPQRIISWIDHDAEQEASGSAGTESGKSTTKTVNRRIKPINCTQKGVCGDIR